jgi:hypothetical protein
MVTSCHLCGLEIEPGQEVGTWRGYPSHLNPCVLAARTALELVAEHARSAGRRRAAARALVDAA